MCSQYLFSCVLIIVFYLFVFMNIASSSTRPNIVLIIADDMGWNDVSYHGSRQFYTLNIDLLAYTGVALKRYYTHCQCTPSRTAMLTGKFAHKTGMQGYPLTNAEDRGIPLTYKLLPQYLKDLGYSTHLVGKWHVGHSRNEYLPINRGFDSHFGHRGGYIDYYDYSLEETWTTGKVSGLDLYKNLTAAWDVDGYITDVYNEAAIQLIKEHNTENPLFLTLSHNAPHAGNDGALLQAPGHEVRAMRQVESPERRIYAAMMKKLDDSVGDVIAALDFKNMLQNTIVVFISDNGGNVPHWASNWPLRGNKMTPWEGGIRVQGLIWSMNLTKTNHIYDGYMHSVDWLPTLLSIAGDTPPENIDGVNQWDAITDNKEAPRNVIYEIDDYSGYATIISGDYKFVKGKVNMNNSANLGNNLRGMTRIPSDYEEVLRKSAIYDILAKAHIDDIHSREPTVVRCHQNSNIKCYSASGTWCLFNIKEDPCEQTDISMAYPDIAEDLNNKIESEMRNVIPRVYPLYRDPRGNPKLFNYTWGVFLPDKSI